MTYPQDPHRPPVVPASPPPAPMNYGPRPPQHYYPQPLVVSVQTPPTSGSAVASMIAGIFGALGGFCLLGVPCIIAVFLGHVALHETKDGEKGGRGMAYAGLILGYLFVAPAVAVLIMALTGTALDSFMPDMTP